MFDLIWLIPFFPLLGVIINAAIGYRLKNNAAGILASAMVGASFVVAVILFFELLSLSPEAHLIEYTLFNWISAGSFSAEIAFQLDPLSMIMILVVTGVSTIIHVYAIGYMHGDRGFRRFFIYMNLFVFAMLLLVMSNNFLLMFVGWEGVGLCSYLLIGFWYEDQYNAYAGRKAFVVNRIGDFGFLLAIFLIVTNFNSLDFTEVFNQVASTQQVGSGLVTAIALLLFVGATGKSAQIPLYVWLPDAMAGPTPVSALIHAATMVTAGVYMVARANIIYMLSPLAMSVVAIVGLLTALYAATIGLTQYDIKRVLAYSTISQLGYMFLGVGLGAFSAGIFHLMTHAFFKALLFLGAGSVMHAMSNHTDMRMMGGLRKSMPATFWTFMIATCAIAGIPGFSGFFSKDEILWQAFAGANGNILFWLIGTIAAAITTFYMFRLVFMTFYGELRADHEIAHHVHESPKLMTVPLMLLGILSLIGGFVGIPAALGGANRFEHFLHPVFARGYEIQQATHNPAQHSHSLELLLMGVVFILVLGSIALAYLMYVKNPSLPERFTQKVRLLHQLVFNKYYIDEVYDLLVVKPLDWMSETVLWKFIDVKIIDGLVNGTGSVVRVSGQALRVIQSGLVQNYALFFVFGALILLYYVVF
jgi:NADH-quinone oxidoreductase subunit L